MQCRICGNGQDNTPYEVHEMMFGTYDPFAYFQCSSCACLQISEVPSNIADYYPPEYYSLSQSLAPQVKQSMIEQLQASIKATRERYEALNRGLLGRIIFLCVPPQTLEVRSLSLAGASLSTRILDVGCGEGKLLNQLCGFGFYNLMGIDPFIDVDLYHENGVIVYKRFLYDTEGTWDIIMCHHSFEHMDNPAEMLSIMSNRLAKGGICIIRIPTVSSYAWKRYKTNWYQIDAPRHLFIHSVESINLLASQAGLVVDKVVYDSTAWQFIASEAYENHKVPLMSSVQKSKWAILTRKARQLNNLQQGDQAAFFLTKV